MYVSFTSLNKYEPMCINVFDNGILRKMLAESIQDEIMNINKSWAGYQAKWSWNTGKSNPIYVDGSRSQR